MEQDYRLAEGEYRFACLVWANEPLGSGQLVALANEALGWKKSTTYTVLKKLCERGILHNANGTVTALVKQAQVQQEESAAVVQKSFGGSLPRFVAAFLNTSSISEEEAADDEYEEDAEGINEEAEAEMEEEGMDSSFSTSMDLADAMNSYFSTLDNLPEADALTSILTRYSDIIFDNVTDGENPGTQSSAAGDVSQELTVLEGHVTQAEAQPMFQQILDTAKTDEELKGLIENWTEAMNDPEYSYDTFLQAIEDLEKDLDGEIDESDTSGFVLRAWVDDNGEVVGREVLADDGEQEESLFSYLCTTDGDQRGFSFTMGSDEDSVGLYGSGTLSGDVLSGTYTFTSGGEDAAVIEVADYDTKAVENGIWKGTYTISGAPIEDEDGNSYDPFGGMQLIFTTDGKDENNMEWNLTLAANGVSLGALSITGGNEGEDLEAVDFASLTDVYDFSNDADVEKFGEDVNMDTITANLTSAGMPDGWLESVMEAASGSGAEEITEYDDQTDMAGDTLDDSETPAA